MTSRPVERTTGFVKPLLTAEPVGLLILRPALIPYPANRAFPLTFASGDLPVEFSLGIGVPEMLLACKLAKPIGGVAAILIGARRCL